LQRKRDTSMSTKASPSGNTVQCIAVCCNVVQCSAVWCSVVQCGAVCCSAVQCGAVCCSVLQRKRDTSMSTKASPPSVAVCCSVLQ